MSEPGERLEHTPDLRRSGPRLREPAGSYVLFRETTRKYREAYERLEAQFESLSARLAETDRELRRSLEEKDRVSSYLTNVLESLTGGVMVVDAGGSITLFNRAAELITGRTQQMALGRPYEQVIGLESGRQNTVLYTLETGISLSNKEKALTHPDGRTIPLGFSTSTVRDESGRVLGAVEVFNDMTEVRRLEAEVQRAHALAALGEMAATVAHEIRNPLGGIATFASLLGRDLAAADPRCRLVDRITQGVGRLDRIVTGLLSYTRPLELKARQIDLVGLVEETIAFFEVDLERSRADVRVNRSFAVEQLICRIDPEQFQQVVLNLLQNAVQAMPEGGCVGVSVEPGADGSGAVFTVQDAGVGISEEVRDHLFTPFFTTKEGGTGLGLVTSRKIVEAHGGQIRVASEPGSGTRFTVALPN